MATHEYTDEQLEKLLERMPQVMIALRDGTGAGELFHALDDFCWHVPSCESGETCVVGQPNKAMREQEEQARNWHIRRDERNGRHTP